MNRVINVEVNGEFVRKDGKNAGVQGEANAASLHITMSVDWEAYAKRIVWRNALGEDPVALLLHVDLSELALGRSPLEFKTPIPGEALAVPGWCSFTIEGYREGEPDAVAISVTDHLLVKPNDDYNAPSEPTPTQAQQLQAQIEAMQRQTGALVSEVTEPLKVWELWDAARAYKPLEKVSRGGSSYICTAPCQGLDPGEDCAGGYQGTAWLLIAAKGDTGAQGKQGLQGVQGEQGIQGVQGIQGQEGPRGMNGVVVETAGMVAFDVTEDGYLECAYTGEKPDYYIDEDGYLCLDINEEGE